MKSELIEVSEDGYENLLIFSDIHLAFLTPFCLNVDNNLDRNVAIEKLEDKDIDACWHGEHYKDFEIAENFILSDKSINRRFRLELEGFSTKSPNAPKDSCLNFFIDIKFFFDNLPRIRHCHLTSY